MAVSPTESTFEVTEAFSRSIQVMRDEQGMANERKLLTGRGGLGKGTTLLDAVCILPLICVLISNRLSFEVENSLLRSQMGKLEPEWFRPLLSHASNKPVFCVLFLISVFINAAGYLLLLGVGFVGDNNVSHPCVKHKL
jgi:hypothetical protein